MQVQVKNHILTKTTITSISYNQIYNLLALVSDASDTVSFYSFDLEPEPPLQTQHNVSIIDSSRNVDTSRKCVSLKERFKGESKPPASGIVAWSNNGLYIGVAASKVQIWSILGGKLSPYRISNQGYIDIKNMAWSPDSKSYLTYGITPKPLPLSISIRTLQSCQHSQILPKQPSVLVSYDPFGKYIVVLSIKNVVQFYDSKSLQSIKCVSLAQSAKDVPTLKQKRIGDWSPQFGYFVCPNLNDGRISTAVVLDRNRGFECRSVLIGHQAIINCLKFNPNLYQHNNKPTFILAMGDSSGCISLWRFQTPSPNPQLLFLCSSPIKVQQSIQCLQWNRQGTILQVNSLKKYITTLYFKQGSFGKKFDQIQKNDYIVGVYGAKGVGDLVGGKLQIFGDGVSMEDRVQYGVKVDVKFDVEDRPKENMIRTKQQVIYRKDANNKEKKRINPSRLIPESQALQEQQSSQQLNATQQSTTAIPVLKLPVLKLAQLKQQLKREYMLPNKFILSAQQSKDIYILTLKQPLLSPSPSTSPLPSSSQSCAQICHRYFPLDLKQIQITDKFMIVLTANKLYIFDHWFVPRELPVYIGEVAMYTYNNEGMFYFMLTNGWIRGFLLQSMSDRGTNISAGTNVGKDGERNVWVETSAAYLFMSPQEGVEITANPFSMFAVYDNDNCRLHVEVKNSLQRYCYDRQMNSWVQLNVQQGLYELGHSLNIPKQQQKTTKQFYTTLLHDPTPPLPSRPLSDCQQQLLYCEPQPHHQHRHSQKYKQKHSQKYKQKHSQKYKEKHSQKYKEKLLKYFIELKQKRNDQVLRKQIEEYFFNTKSGCYMGEDAQMWEKVRKIGGGVIQEFTLIANIRLSQMGKNSRNGMDGK